MALVVLSRSRVADGKDSVGYFFVVYLEH
jgi:hypothetical protein